MNTSEQDKEDIVTSVSTKNVQSISDEQLAEESAKLAELRTEIRERQNEVNDEIELRNALKGVSASARGRLTKIRLEGGIAPAGETNGGQS